MPKKKTQPRGPQLDIAGALCVAFVNTASARQKNRQFGVASYDQLLTWALQAELLSPDQGADTRRQAAEQPQQVERVLAQALELRATLRRLFLAVAKGRDLPPDDLAALNRELAKTLPPMTLTFGAQGLMRDWTGNDGALDRVLWPVLQSTADLLVTNLRVASCAAPECKLMFVDDSPSRKRVWCDYRVCGRRVNSLSYYHRRGKRERGRF